MAKLNQIIAIEKGVKSRIYAYLTEINKAVQKPALFDGFSKSFASLEDEGGEQLPPESKKVQLESRDIIKGVSAALGELFKLTARKDWTNCVARGNVVIDGTVLISDVPVPFLLFLEKQLNDLHTLVKNIPTLDIAEDWSLDPNSGFYRTAETKTHRTKKVQKPLVLYPATPEHPAQTQLITEDIISGYWIAVKQSGALPRTQKDDYLAKIETVTKAVKEAREQANNTDEATAADVAEPVFGYIFGLTN